MSRDSTDVLQVSLDVSAVPARPGRRRAVHPRARHSPREAPRLRPDPRRPERRRRPAGHGSPRTSESAPSCRGPGWHGCCTSRPASAHPRPPAAPPVEVHHGPHYTMPRRSKLPCVVTVHDLTFFDHPEWHERSKVAWFRAATRYSAAPCRRDRLCRARPRRNGWGNSFRLDVRWWWSGMGWTEIVSRRKSQDPVSTVRSWRDSVSTGRTFCTSGPCEPRKGIADLGRSLRAAGGRSNGPRARAGRWRGVGRRARACSRSRLLGPAAGSAALVMSPTAMSRPCSAGASVVAYPSLEEGFGLPALEALACGAPLVTTAGTPMAEIAGDSALVVPAGQPVALAEAIEEAITAEPSLEGARRRAEGLTIAGRHSWEACARGTSRDLPACDGALSGRPGAADSLNPCAPT